MIDDTQDNEKPTSQKNNRMLLHESMTAVKLNEDMEWLTVQVKPGHEEIFRQALQDEFDEHTFLFIIDESVLHIGVSADQAGEYSDMDLRKELKELLVSADRKQPSAISDIYVAKRLEKIIKELVTRAFSTIVCMQSEFIDGFRWLSPGFRDALALLKGEELEFCLLEDLLFVADDFDTLVEQLAQKTVVVTAVCVNETDDSLERLTPCSQPTPIDLEITGALAKSEALGKGAAYYHPTPGYDEFLAYCSWRFHEPIPVEDIQSITTIFKRLSDLGLPSSRYFLELRDLGEDSVFTVFAPDYEEWYAHIWDLELLRA